jgi:hypothetical protein
VLPATLHRFPTTFKYLKRSDLISYEISFCFHPCLLLSAGYFSLPVATLQPGVYKLNLNGVDRGKPLSHSWLKVGVRKPYEHNRISLISSGSKIIMGSI